MGIQHKIDFLQLDRLLREKKSTNEIAKYFSVTPGAVSQAKKKLKYRVIKTVALEKANEVVESHLDMMSQLRKVNRAINEELDRAKEDILTAGASDKKGIQEIIVKLSAEVRKQLALQLSIAEVWHDQKIVAEFQRELLDVLNEVKPELKNEVIRRLKERRALRGSVSIP